MAPTIPIPMPTTHELLTNSSEVGLRAKRRTRPYWPLPMRLKRSSSLCCVCHTLSMKLIGLLYKFDAVSALQFVIHSRWRSQYLRRFDTSNYKHHTDLMLESRIYRSSPNYSGFFINLTMYFFHHLMCFFESHIITSGDINQRSLGLIDFQFQ